MSKDIKLNEKASIEYFMNRFNCSQSVLMSYKNYANIPEKQLLRISTGFGAGMGKMQDTCGAITGSYMILGLCYGKDNIGDDESKERTYDQVQRFESEFRKLHGTTACKELLGCDLKTEDGKKYYDDHHLKEEVCLKCILDSIKILQRILKEENARINR